MPPSARRYIYSRLWLIIATVLFIAAAKAEATPSSANSLREENAAFEAELALARKGVLYIVFNLPAGTATLKARVMGLRSFTIWKSNSTGRKPDLKPLEIAERKAFSPPKRKQIDPAAKKEMNEVAGGTLQSSYEIEALELDDMPSDFELYLADRSVIRIHSARQGFSGAIKSAGLALWNGISGLFRTRPANSIEIVMPENDARALYWVAAEKTPVLLIGTSYAADTVNLNLVPKTPVPPGKPLASGSETPRKPVKQ